MYRRITALLVAASVSTAIQAQSHPDSQGLSYQHLSVRDFEVDADALVAAHKRVEITGAYAVAGQLEQLYANTNDVALNREGIGSATFIPLLTAHSSREFRAAMFDCRSSGAFACEFTVRGLATQCMVTNAFGASQESACIAVEDGQVYRLPPPTPEQLAASRAMMAEAERQRLAALPEQVKQWEAATTECLTNSDFARSQATSASQSPAGGLLNRLLNPERARAADAERRAFAAQRLYELCTHSRPWPPGGAVPAPLPAPIENVIDQCTQVHAWGYCTGNNPPHP